jgi:hypothetical protein
MPQQESSIHITNKNILKPDVWFDTLSRTSGWFDDNDIFTSGRFDDEIITVDGFGFHCFRLI